MKKLLPLLFLVTQLLSASTIDDFVNDITFAKEQLTNNHPGMHDTQNPVFADLLNQAYSTAIARAPLITEENYRTELNNFTHSFNDAHVYCSSNSAISSTVFKQFECGYIPDLQTTVVKLPTFFPDKNGETLLNNVIASLALITEHKKIIFDLRGNSGGNSMWGNKIFNTLFGGEYVAACIRERTKHEYVEWRASTDNLAYLCSIQNKLASAPNPTSQDLVLISYIAQKCTGIADAIACGKTYFEDEHKCTIAVMPPEPTQRLEIVIIIDEKNVSAALDFIDMAKSLNMPVTLIGKTTKADSIYMELRSVQLPSKRAHLNHPLKVYRNRPRGHNQPYVPDITVDIPTDISIQNLATLVYKLQK